MRTIAPIGKYYDELNLVQLVAAGKFVNSSRNGDKVELLKENNQEICQYLDTKIIDCQLYPRQIIALFGT